MHSKHIKLRREEIEQIKLFDWIRSQKTIEPFAWHTPNERKTSPARGKILKRMGVKSGVADLFIAIPSKGYNGLFIELKVGCNKLSDNQCEFLERMLSKGYQALCCYGFEEAKGVIQDYLG